MSIRSLRSKVRQKSGLVWLVAIGVSVSVAAGCSSDFSSCEDSKTCPGGAGSSGAAGSATGGGDTAGAAQAGAPDDGGSVAGMGVGGSGIGVGGSPEAGAGPAAEAGAGGEAGEATVAPKPQCVVAEDCDDHLACDGVESCVLGVCKPGVSPCANPDPAHCDAVCTEANGAASCLVQGQDKDHDGYLSNLCLVSAKPATDCDDNVATTHPGAPELCDRVDNNCNGKIDLEDGLTVSGTSTQLGVTTSATRAAPAIAWATDKSVYGVVWYDGSTSTIGDVYFETFNQAGVTGVAPELVNAAKTTNTAGLGLTFGGDSFGVTWVDGSAVDLREVTSAGVLAANTTLVDMLSFSSGPKVAQISGGNWVVAWSAFAGGGVTNTWLASVLSGVAGQANTIGAGTGPGLAASGQNFIVALDAAGAAAAEVGSNVDGTTVSTPLTLVGSKPVVAGGPNGFAVAVARAGSAALYTYAPTGTAVCGPVNIGDATFVPAAIVPTATGYLVVSSGVVRVQEVLAGCKLGQLFTVDAGPATNVSIAGSAAGYGIVWQDTTAAEPKRHLFGPNFCN
jgi:hypothetical protein